MKNTVKRGIVGILVFLMVLAFAAYPYLRLMKSELDEEAQNYAVSTWHYNRSITATDTIDRAQLSSALYAEVEHYPEAGTDHPIMRLIAAHSRLRGMESFIYVTGDTFATDSVEIRRDGEPYRSIPATFIAWRDSTQLYFPDWQHLHRLMREDGHLHIRIHLRTYGTSTFHYRTGGMKEIFNEESEIIDLRNK